MKTLVRAAPLALAAALGLAGLPATARAQYLGQFGPLNSMGTGQKALGLYLGAGPTGLGAAAEIRANHSERGTFGVQFAVQHSIFAGQADIRAGLLSSGGDFPVMLGGELAGGVVSGGGTTAIYAQAVPGLSWEMDAGGGQSWAAWAGLGFRVSASQHKLGHGDTLIRAGGRFSFSRELGLTASLEDVAGSSHLMVGAESRFGGHGGSNVPGGK
ncbi:MAG TPA: hypothetical protein VMS93_08220 [Candidatus Saccharimonadales bacterium]|nr:hypothetical protein [Candidatus Saccharimonadales bacterium]